MNGLSVGAIRRYRLLRMVSKESPLVGSEREAFVKFRFG